MSDSLATRFEIIYREESLAVSILKILEIIESRLAALEHPNDLSLAEIWANEYEDNKTPEPREQPVQDKRLAAAASEAYLKALDDFAEKWRSERCESFGGEILNANVVIEEIEQFKTDYLARGGEEHGKVE